MRKEPYVVGSYVHIVKRGVRGMPIVRDEIDQWRFLLLLRHLNNEQGIDNWFRDLIDENIAHTLERPKSWQPQQKIVRILSFCLLDNHFHLLLKEIKKGGISTFMQKLTTGYSMYFNRKHDRVGPLFQSRFKAEHVNEDSYLKYLFAYIHLNPIKLIEPKWREEGINDTNKTKKFLTDYKYSSYQDYIGKTREESLILSRNEFPEYFSSTSNYEGFINEILRSNTEDNT